MKIFILATALTLSSLQLKSIYNRLDPLSVNEHLAFHAAYGDCDQGREALRHAWRLLSQRSPRLEGHIGEETRPTLPLLIGTSLPELTDEHITLIEQLSAHLPHKRLKGHYATSEEEVLALPDEEIDLARAVMLSCGESDKKRRAYEALLDFMALQISAYFNEETSDQEKVRAINHFLFEELFFRFPPLSKYEEQIDDYTFLTSVMEKRRGVCLGVSTLYLSIAQRLNLLLEVITPPGHIYIRLRGEDGKTLNIETTARGIHLPSSSYLNINTHTLQQRTIKEVVGLTHINAGSLHLQTGHYTDAINAYKKALPYLDEDPFIQELMGYALILNGEEGVSRLQSLKANPYVTYQDTLPEEVVRGDATIDGLKAVLMSTGDDRESILSKERALRAAVEEHPRFLTGWFHLAMTYMQLHQQGEALKALKNYHALESHNPVVEYLLAKLYFSRFYPQKAWEHLLHAEDLYDGTPSAPVVELRRLMTQYDTPQPTPR